MTIENRTPVTNPSFLNGNNLNLTDPPQMESICNLLLHRLDAPQSVSTMEIKPPAGIGVSLLLGFDARGRAVTLGTVFPHYTRTVTTSPVVFTRGPVRGGAIGQPVSLTTLPSGSQPAAGKPAALSSGPGQSSPPLGVTPPKPPADRQIGDAAALARSVGPAVSSSIVNQSSSGSSTPNSSTYINSITTRSAYRGGASSTVTVTMTTTVTTDPAASNLQLLVFGSEPNGGVQRHEVKLGQGADLVCAALSPQGDWIAYVQSVVHPPAIYPWTLWLYQRTRQQPAGSVGYSIWKCRLDGSDLQRIGPEVTSSSSRTLTELRWLPDGKRVSFLYNDALYTLPAN